MEVDAYLAEQVAAGADPTDEQFRLLVQSVTDYAIFLLDSGGRVISWDEGPAHIQGHQAGGIIRPPLALVSSPERRAPRPPQRGPGCAGRDGRLPTAVPP